MPEQLDALRVGQAYLQDSVLEWAQPGSKELLNSGMQ